MNNEIAADKIRKADSFIKETIDQCRVSDFFHKINYSLGDCSAPVLVVKRDDKKIMIGYGYLVKKLMLELNADYNFVVDCIKESVCGILQKQDYAIEVVPDSDDMNDSMEFLNRQKGEDLFRITINIKNKDKENKQRINSVFGAENNSENIEVSVNPEGWAYITNHDAKINIDCIIFKSKNTNQLLNKFTVEHKFSFGKVKREFLPIAYRSASDYNPNQVFIKLGGGIDAIEDIFGFDLNPDEEIQIDIYSSGGMGLKHLVDIDTNILAFRLKNNHNTERVGFDLFGSFYDKDLNCNVSIESLLGTSEKEISRALIGGDSFRVNGLKMVNSEFQQVTERFNLSRKDIFGKECFRCFMPINYRGADVNLSNQIDVPVGAIEFIVDKYTLFSARLLPNAEMILCFFVSEKSDTVSLLNGAKSCEQTGSYPEKLYNPAI